MVKGIDIFQEYFNEYTDQYVLIGGAACSVSFEKQDINFGRTTKDLDIVLIVEAQTKEFGERFWKFIKDGKYRIRAKSNGEPQFYRFDKPEDERFPKMIELFSRTNYLLQEENGLTPIHIDDSVSSLSAILLNDAYYQALMDGREITRGISVLKPEWIIPFKAKAWLDLREKKMWIHRILKNIEMISSELYLTCFYRSVSYFFLRICTSGIATLSKLTLEACSSSEEFCSSAV